MLRNWLKKATEAPPPSPELPDPRSAKTPHESDIIAACNHEISKSTPSPSVKRKRGIYNTYDSTQRAKMARYAVDHGVAVAARHFTTSLRKNVNESTIRNLKKEFLRIRKDTGSDPSTLEKAERRAPLLLGKYEEDVKTYVSYVRNFGGVINTHLLIGCAKGIIKNKDKQLLFEYGGSINITKTWAQSFLRRHGYVKRKGTKAARKVPNDFDFIRMEFLGEVSKLVKDNEIPPELIINFDQTNVNIIPVGDYTLEKSGAKQVQIIGLEDKRQITVLLGCTMAGEMIPPQLIYQGKTEKCHPKFPFPKKWHITHSENHWSNEVTMLEYVDKTLVPYIEGIREDLPLNKSNAHALCIFDVFRAHQCESFINKLSENDIKVRFVPASCTGELQPLDLSGNDTFKQSVKNAFQSWYADEIDKNLRNGQNIDELDVDLSLSHLKPIHARWLVSAYQKITADVIKLGWKKAGILEAVS